MCPAPKSIKELASQTISRRTVVKIRRLVNLFQSLRTYRFSFPVSGITAPPSPFPFMVNRENDLERIASRYQPTKHLHNYLAYYWMHFRDIRMDVRNMLEIGLQTDRSIRMWEEFFPNARIYGIDIDPECAKLAGDRRRIYIGDQSDSAFLKEVVRDAGFFDIIIDDGSHLVEHQLKTFELLFPVLSEHGLYVVEDTGGCVADFYLRTVNAIKGLVDYIFHWPEDADPRDWPAMATFPQGTSWAARNIVGVAFYRWIVFVMKGRNPEDNPYLEKGLSSEKDIL